MKNENLELEEFLLKNLSTWEIEWFTVKRLKKDGTKGE